SLPVAKSATRLVLQPMNGAAPLRAWCINQGWKIVDETLVEEASKLYVIIVLELGEQAPLEATVAEVGPLLLANKHHLLGKHIQKLIRHYNKLLNSMLHSEAARESAKYQEFALRKQELEAIARDYDCC
ncbi:MAG: tRNA (adenine(22)-N(1))-methyltransferase TrmK, partial [Acidaminococcaceae bacterium]